MGLPSYLKHAIKDNDLTFKNSYFDKGLFIGFYICKAMYRLDVNGRLCDYTNVCHDRMCFADLKKYAINRAWKLAYDFKYNDYDYNKNYEKVDIVWFTEWVKKDGKWFWNYKELKCNKYFAEKAEEISKHKRDAEFKIIQQKEELDKIKSIEQGRKFTGRLRQLIMDRDEYRCVLCGRGVDSGIKLEVDHIIQWSDGGKTVYDNGRTVCDECNKGLYHLSQYNKKVNELKSIIN